jgi:hypothetical protein
MQRILVFTSILILLLHTQTASAGLSFLKLFVAKSHPSCTKALPSNHQKFCSTFRNAAECACTSSGLPNSMCQNMKSLHERMITVFSSELEACKYQHDTTTQNCLDGWACYRRGGKDSHGRLCQTNGASCA